MNAEPILAVIAKIEWAKAEIEKLNTEIGKFFQRNPYKVRSRINSNGTEEIWSFHFRGVIPPMISVTCGNIMKNLREPLDNVLAAVSMLHRGTDTGVSFPFCSNIKDYESELAKLEKLLPTGSTDLIRKAQTYPGGNSHIRALHFINRNDKHRARLIVLNLKNTFSMQSLIVHEGWMFQIGYNNGQNLIINGPPAKIKPSFSRGAAIIKPCKSRPFIQFNPAVNGAEYEMEFATTLPGTKFEAEIQPSFNIAFSEAPGLEREPIVVALHQMSQLVESIVLTLRDRFF